MSTSKAYKELKLVFPTEKYKGQMEEYVQEHFANNEYDLAGDGGLDTIRDFDKWLYKVRNDVSEETIEKGQVTSTLFLAVRKSDDKVIGTLQIRHFLSEWCIANSGHIGDGVRPSERNKGYSTEMIRLALEECKKLGIYNVLMICNRENIGSAKSIKNNGGILQDEILVENGNINQRYRINLK